MVSLQVRNQIDSEVKVDSAAATGFPRGSGVGGRGKHDARKPYNMGGALTARDTSRWSSYKYLTPTVGTSTSRQDKPRPAGDGLWPLFLINCAVF